MLPILKVMKLDGTRWVEAEITSIVEVELEDSPKCKLV